MSYTTLKFRIKDSVTKKHLNAMASAVNFVWNYCNEMSVKRFEYNGEFLSGYDLGKLTAGCTRDLNLVSCTIEAVCQQYALKRKQFKKIKLRWRSYKRSIGWIPFKKNITLLEDGKFKYYGKVYRFWQTQPIGEIKCGSFTQDAKGRWYVCFVTKEPITEIQSSGKAVGIDLGLKATATYSNGEIFEGLKSTRNYADELAKAQRARKKKRIVAIHTKIANTRKDSIHKETTRVAGLYDTIVIGNVSSKKLVKTRFAKSVLDAGWGLYCSFLESKAKRLGKRVVHVKENYSTVTCSNCFDRTFQGGLRALEIREWTCSSCGSHHDRDVNAAKNILRLGHQTLLEEAP